MRTEITNGGDGRIPGADKAIHRMPSLPPQSDDGLWKSANQAVTSLPSSSSQSGEAHSIRADRAKIEMPSPPPDIEAAIAGIRRAHRERCFAMEQRKRSDLSLGAFLRTALGWSKSLPDKDRAAIAKRAAALIAIGEAEAKGKDAKGEAIYEEFRALIEASLKAREPWDVVEATALKRMVKLAKTLPVYAWAKDVRGFGEASLAVIAAEAGDLNNYATHSKLWKRMGVAVMDGVRQGGLAKNASKEDWIEHGYNRQRRSKLWNIGDSLLKAQVRKVLDDGGDDHGSRTSLGVYGQAYLDRKAYELARDPEIAPIKAHRRAQRYMEKKLLRDLWRAWRNEPRAKDEVPEVALGDVPAVHPDERKANIGMPGMA